MPDYIWPDTRDLTEPPCPHCAARTDENERSDVSSAESEGIAPFRENGSKEGNRG